METVLNQLLGKNQKDKNRIEESNERIKFAEDLMIYLLKEFCMGKTLEVEFGSQKYTGRLEHLGGSNIINLRAKNTFRYFKISNIKSIKILK